MKARQFFDLVVEMRQAQKAYFKRRTQENLKTSIAIELQVDKEIQRVLKILQTKELEERTKKGDLTGVANILATQYKGGTK